MANVSMLDDQQRQLSVALTDADADGTYTGTHTISANNAALNGDAINHRYRYGRRWQQQRCYRNGHVAEFNILHFDTTTGYQPVPRAVG